MALGGGIGGYDGGGPSNKGLQMGLADTLRLAWADPDLQARIIFILKIFALYVLGLHVQVPIPNVNSLHLDDLLKNNPFFNMMNTFGGGGLKRVSIFALGLSPYITASIIMQILTTALPHWKKEMQEGGEHARNQQNKRTRMLTLVLCVFQGLQTIRMMQASGAAALPNNLQTIAAVTIFWMAGSMFLLWMGEQLTQKGIGNGTSLLIFAGIVITFPNQIQVVFKNFNSISKLGIIAVAVLFVAMTWFVVYFTLAQRRIPIQHTRRQMGTKVIGGGASYLPFSVNMVGVIPIIFASALIYMPLQFASMFPANSPASNFLHAVGDFTYPNLKDPKGYVAALLYMLLIFFFTYFYTAIQYNVDDIADNLKRNQSMIPGIRPGKQTRDFLDTVISRVTVVGALFLSVVSLSQYLVPVLINVQGLNMMFGTSLLIMVSVALETMRQIQANLIMKQYGQ